MELTEYEGDYYIKLKSDPRTWWKVPNSVRVFCDGGTVTFYDEDDKTVYCVGAGQWIEVAYQSVMEIVFADFGE